MEEQSLTEIINYQMGLDLPPKISFDQMRQQLQAAINELIKSDFQKLVNVLYRVDVNERKLKYLLQENVGADAAVIIADLIIERQLEKIKTRAAFTDQDGSDTSDQEKW
jgi:stress response protein SCP2